MSRQLGSRLPPALLRALDGHDLAGKIGPAYLLVSTDPDGTPRPCLLSAGELLAVAADRLRVALWPGSRTCGNLDRGGRVLLSCVAEGTVLHVKGRARPLNGDASVDAGDAARRFEVEVDAVESDAHEGMPVASGVTFTVPAADSAAVVTAWRRQLDALRAP